MTPPARHGWAEAGRPERLVEQTVPNGEAKVLACYGAPLSPPGDVGWSEEAMWLRFVEGRPVSVMTTEFGEWSTAKEARRKRVRVLIWDNAGWHTSHVVRA